MKETYKQRHGYNVIAITFHKEALAITANPAGLIDGTYQGSITVTSVGAANSPLMIPVTYLLSGASNAHDAE